MSNVPRNMPPASERSLQASLAARTSWANTTNPTARTAPARAAFDAKLLEQAGGDPIRAAHLRKAHFARLALKSAQSRRRAKEALEAAAADYERAQGEARQLEADAEAAEAELAHVDGTAA